MIFTGHRAQNAVPLAARSRRPDHTTGSPPNDRKSIEALLGAAVLLCARGACRDQRGTRPHACTILGKLMTDRGSS